MKKILTILAAAFGALFFACAPVVNGSASFTAENASISSNSFNTSAVYNPNANDIVEGFVIAKTADGFDKTLFTDKGIDVCGELSLTGTGFTYWYLHKNTGNEALLKSVFSIKGVLSADNDYKVASPKIVESKYIALSPSSTEPVASTQGLGDGNVLQDPVSDAESYALDITKALQAYKDIGYGNKDVVAGIIDTGINMLHEDFNAGSESVVLYAKSARTSGSSYIGDGNPFTEVPLDSNWDTDGHGTHCSGIMCALGDNDKGIAGVAWKKTKLISYQSLGFKGGGTAWAVYGALADLTNTVEILRKAPGVRTAEEKAKLPSYVDSNFQITQKTVPVNMSLGGSIGSEYAFSILTNALMHDVLPVIAMGNEGRYTAAYPAAFPGVLAVGATNGKDKKARFSNSGAWISVAAPGESIISCGNSTASSYVSLSGTSMAAPFVTGFISYLLSFDNARSLTPYQIKTLIENTADKIDGAASFDERFGHGRVNVLAAADSVQKNTVPAANALYGEGTVTVRIKNKGVYIPIRDKVSLVDGTTNVPLAYVGPNSQADVAFKGLVKGKSYSVFVTCGGETQKKDFTVDGTDQYVDADFNTAGMWVSTVSNSYYNGGADTTDTVIAVFKAQADGSFNPDNLILRYDRDALDTLFFVPEASAAYYVLVTGAVEGSVFKGGNYGVKIGDAPLTGGINLADGTRTPAANDLHEKDDDPDLARIKGSAWNKTFACNLVSPGTNHSGEPIPDYDFFVVPALGAVQLVKPATPSLVPDSKGLKASWTPVSGATRYCVNLYEDGEFKAARLVDAAASPLETYFPGQNPAKNYTVRVQAQGNLTSSADSELSDESAAAHPYPMLPGVENLTASAGFSSVTVDWSKPTSVTSSNIGGYKVHIIDAVTWRILKEETTLFTREIFYSIRKGRYRAEVQIIAASGGSFENSAFVQSSVFQVR